MKFKQLLLFSCALLISVSASAFELGKKNATIWHTKESKAQAEVLQKYLGKVFGKIIHLQPQFQREIIIVEPLFECEQRFHIFIEAIKTHPPAGGGEITIGKFTPVIRDAEEFQAGGFALDTNFLQRIHPIAEIAVIVQRESSARSRSGDFYHHLLPFKFFHSVAHLI